MQSKLKRILGQIVFNTPLREYLFYKHKFMFTVPQLIFLCECVEQVKGAIAEVGCANGRTTVFINKYMDAQRIEKKYYAVDTFSGFVAEDINYEFLERNKKPSYFPITFHENMKKWFEYTMNLNSIRRVVAIQADVNKLDLTTLGALSFVLLDVDLYRPVKKSLPELYEALAPNGILIVDDCDSRDMSWDGSYQAYIEFMKEINQPIKIVYDKLGVVKKQKTPKSI